MRRLDGVVLVLQPRAHLRVFGGSGCSPRWALQVEPGTAHSTGSVPRAKQASQTDAAARAAPAGGPLAEASQSKR